jgi:hypothetical protein
MAKKSKIVKNDQRRRMVERHAERRAELKQIVSDPRVRLSNEHVRWPPCRRCRATPAPCACETVMPSTVARADTSASSDCPGYGSVSSHTNATRAGAPTQ